MQRGWEFRNLIDATVNVKVEFTEVDLARFEFSMSQEIPKTPEKTNCCRAVCQELT